MASTISKAIAKPLLAIFALELVLPLLLALLMLGIKLRQQQVIDAKAYETTVRVRLTEVQETLNGDEFELNGIRYDIAGHLVDNGEVYLVAIADTDETKLVEVDVHLFEKQHSKQGSRQHGPPFFTFLYYEHITPWSLRLLQPSDLDYCFIQPLHPVTIVGKPGPPPWA